MKVLMVSTEYPPMSGGVGRYTSNLSRNLSNMGIEVYVACNQQGAGNFVGLSPNNSKNSELLLDIVDELRPDVVHVQFEPGLYGLFLDANPSKTGTYIDKFYRQCTTPIVTTFHTGYTLKEWLSQSTLVKKTGRTGIWGVPLRAAVRFLSYSLNYRAFVRLNREKMNLSEAGITFSRHMAGLLGDTNCHILYHGCDPDPSVRPDKHAARDYFALAQDSKIALAVGFGTITKGWDVLEKLTLPESWLIVTNSSKSHYNTETVRKNRNGLCQIIDLERGFLSEAELSLLFYASDVLLLPYTATSGSGVMFDGLAHGIPFVSSDLRFFKEFSEIGLGIAVQRNPPRFATSILEVDNNQRQFRKNIEKFRANLSWRYIAEEHVKIYAAIGNQRVN